MIGTPLTSELAGLELDVGHVPAFPTLFGFVYHGRTSIWAVEREGS